MTKFFSEFKKFISRGNVVDLAVGVMVGSAFTAMVNGLSNYILKPLINFFVAKLIGGDSMADMHTFLTRVYDEAGELDLAKSIYIDWSSFISTIINFIIIAFTLFCIVKVINKIRDDQKEFADLVARKTLSRKERKELKKLGIKICDREAVKAYKEQKEAEERAMAEAAKREAEEKAKREREENPTDNDLLKLILAEMRKK